jgi:hypothetical protein
LYCIYGYTFIYRCILYIMICWSCVRVKKFMLLLGSRWFRCLNRSLRRDKSMRCHIFQFVPKVVSMAQPFTYTNLCFQLR